MSNPDNNGNVGCGGSIVRLVAFASPLPMGMGSAAYADSKSFVSEVLSPTEKKLMAFSDIPKILLYLAVMGNLADASATNHEVAVSLGIAAVAIGLIQWAVMVNRI